jgi:DNA topoisomerase III
MGPPLLYDLTELQRHANRLFGFSAQKTLDTAQALYERHKLISYPRTDSRHLSQDVADAAADRAGHRGPYRSIWRRGPASAAGPQVCGRCTKVTDHHAIIPTVTRRSARSVAR